MIIPVDVRAVQECAPDVIALVPQLIVPVAEIDPEDSAPQVILFVPQLIVPVDVSAVHDIAPLVSAFVPVVIGTAVVIEVVLAANLDTPAVDMFNTSVALEYNPHDVDDVNE